MAFVKNGTIISKELLLIASYSSASNKIERYEEGILRKVSVHRCFAKKIIDTIFWIVSGYVLYF